MKSGILNRLYSRLILELVIGVLLMSKRNFVRFNNHNFYENPANGYWEAKIKKNGKRETLRLQRAVWEFYNGEIIGDMHVHHIDGNKANNNIENLELLTPLEHAKKHGKRTAALWDREEMQKARAYGLEKCKNWHASEEGKKWHSEHQKITTQKNIITKICTECGKEFRTWHDKREQSMCLKCRDKYLQRELRRLKKTKK